MKPELDCKDASRLISAALDRPLPQEDRARLHRHFVICSACRSVNQQMDFLRRAMWALGGHGAEDHLDPGGAEGAPTPDSGEPDVGGSR